MKIAFWSERRRAGTTFNLAVIACVSVIRHPISAAVVSGGYRNEMLERGLLETPGLVSGMEGFGQGHLEESSMVAETQQYFTARGLDCLLLKERREELTELVLKANMRQVVEGRMYCLPSSVRTEQEWWRQDSAFVRMSRVLDAVESCFDVVFIDCGSRKDDYAQKVLKEADVCVLNMSQENEGIGDFYRSPRKYPGKPFFLLGNYFEDAVYNRENLHRIYRVEEECLGAVPYNPWLQEASQKGKLMNGVKRCLEQEALGKNVEFSRELVRTANLILKLAGLTR